MIEKVLNKCAPQKVGVDYAIELIRSSEICAVGERGCNSLHQDMESGNFDDATKIVAIGSEMHQTKPLIQIG